ncbi:Scr1 family TA system antitoxin-like transcriptional regulator [Streptomyces sp. NPDC091272]|uniref:helix-turn-helix domain-containing protein n=1 Tax=Streptomyces sp. NPDC091272 TaxID=3365981 RepID=UPI003824843C
MPTAREPDPSENIEQYIGNAVQEARLARMRAKVPGEDWSQTFLAKRVFVSQSRISEVETGDAPPDTGLARKLESVLGLRSDQLVDLVRILEQATVKDYAKPFLRRQAQAELLHVCDRVVPGLLQTPDYARELLLSGQAGDPRRIESFIEQRMAWQAIWQREDPPWMSVVLAEPVLYGATEPQLKRLLDAQETANITLRVLPYRAGHILGHTTILTLPGGLRGAYTEGFSTGHYSEETARITRFQKVYDRLAADALTAEASTASIHEALRRFS